MINLFNFATSELSQDAILCWLLSWNDQKKFSLNKNEELRKVSNNLILLFLHQHDKYKSITSKDIEYIHNLDQQYHKTDVYFQVKLTKYAKSISIIIEDKTNTSHHSNQLERYIECIQHDKIKKHDIVGIYFKTGFIKSVDRQLPKQYKLVTNTMFNEFLNTQICSNEIFMEYKSYFNAYQSNFDIAINQAISDTDFDKGLRTMQGQDALIQLIRKDIDNTSVNYGMNKGGTPWTHLAFYFFNPKSHVDSISLHDFNEKFFLRVDYRQGPNKKWTPYLAFRSYCRYGKNENSRIVRIQRLNFYKSIFNDCWNRITEDTGSSITRSKVVGDNSGNYEQEVATIFLNETNNVPTKVIPIITKLMNAFQQELNLRFTDFRVLEEIKQPLISKINNHFDSPVMLSYYYHNCNNERLCELRFSLTTWVKNFGEDGVVVIIYQHKHTKGLSIRTFCETGKLQQNEPLKQYSRTKGELNIKPISGWSTWSTFYNEDDYPDESYHMDFCVDSLGNKIIESLQKADKYLTNVMSG
jgi:hypothetical protein